MSEASQHAAGVETIVLIKILESLQECSDLSPMEKETLFRFAKDQDRAHIYSERQSMMSRLLLHSEFEVVELRICGTDDSHPPFGKRINPEQYTGGAITGVKGNIPIGCLSVKQSSRQTAPVTNVVSGGVLKNDPRKSGNHGGGGI